MWQYAVVWRLQFNLDAVEYWLGIQGFEAQIDSLSKAMNSYRASNPKVRSLRERIVRSRQGESVSRDTAERIYAIIRSI